MMLTPVSQILNREKGTRQIGNTIFVDGTPYLACGVCEMPIKHQSSAPGHVKIDKGRMYRILEPYTVQVGYWISHEETQSQYGQLVVVRKSKPVVHSVPSCFDCWDKQQKLKIKSQLEAEAYNRNKKSTDPTRSPYIVMYKVDRTSSTTSGPLIPSSRVWMGKSSIAPIESRDIDLAPKTHNTQWGLLSDLADSVLESIRDSGMNLDKLVKATTTLGHIGNMLLRTNR